MAGVNSVQVTDRDGWTRIFSLDKSLTYIGSAPGNELVLSPARGGGVAARHLQLIATRERSAPLRAINLADVDLLLDGRTLTPRAAAEIEDGDTLRVGDFTLTFRLERRAETEMPVQQGVASTAGVASAGEDASSVIGLSLSLSRLVLDPDHAIEGSITLRNLGNQPGAQFKLEAEGLPGDCVSMGPGPVLFPNGQKQVFVRLTHPRGPALPPGPVRLSIRATAPDAYPGACATVAQALQVLPFYQHSVQLLSE